MQNDALIKKVESFTKPIADELKYELYHIEYVKENGEFYLRIYIDKEGGISLEDCEKLSRRVSEIIDVEDPIKEAYFLEVSSPGLNRALHTNEHFKRFVGREVLIKLKSAIDGEKTISGKLTDCTEESIIVSNEKEIEIPKVKIKSANLDGEI